MTIVANNSYKFNYCMDLWALKDYTAGELFDSWNRIYDYAKDEDSQDARFFLEDCMDILYEKVLALTEKDQIRILDKASGDLETYNRAHRCGAA